MVVAKLKSREKRIVAISYKVSFKVNFKVCLEVASMSLTTCISYLCIQAKSYKAIRSADLNKDRKFRLRSNFKNWILKEQCAWFQNLRQPEVQTVSEAVNEVGPNCASHQKWMLKGDAAEAKRKPHNPWRAEFLKLKLLDWRLGIGINHGERWTSKWKVSILNLLTSF